MRKLRLAQHLKKMTVVTMVTRSRIRNRKRFVTAASGLSAAWCGVLITTVKAAGAGDLVVPVAVPDVAEHTGVVPRAGQQEAGEVAEQPNIGLL